jgi:hypothetical protein
VRPTMVSSPSSPAARSKPRRSSFPPKPLMLTPSAFGRGGAPVAGVVFVSGVYRDVMRALRSPAVPPRALVVAHPGDQCPLTSPALAQEFVAWARGRVALPWVQTQGSRGGKDGGPFGAHGFFRNDAAPIAAIIGFVKSAQ